MYDLIFRIIVFGDDNAGKTTLIQKLLADYFFNDNLIATIGVDCYAKRLTVDEQDIKLQILVLSGAPRFRFLIKNYIKGALGGLFVFDIAYSSSLAHIDDWLSVIRKIVGTKALFPILVVGLLPEDRNKRKVSTEEGVKIANSKNLDGYIECNPQTGKNVEKTFEALTRLILARY